MEPEETNQEIINTLCHQVTIRLPFWEDNRPMAINFLDELSKEQSVMIDPVE